MKCITAGAGIDGADAGGNKFILEQAAVSAAPVLLDTCIVENQYIVTTSKQNRIGKEFLFYDRFKRTIE